MTFRFSSLLIWLLFLVLPAISLGATHKIPTLGVFSQIAGEIRRETIERGDTLISISARLGVRLDNLASANDIENPAMIFAGEVVSADTRRIVPAFIQNGLVVDIAGSSIFVMEEGKALTRIPAGFGRVERPTPIGSFSVLFTESDPGWPFPPTLREEVDRGRAIRKKRIPAQPPFTLGPHWIQLSTWGVGIHSTPFPTTIGGFIGDGLIRVEPLNMELLVKAVQPGTKVEIGYMPVRSAVTPDGSVWLEAHPDIYELGAPGLEAVVTDLAKRAARIDTEAVARILKERTGLPEIVGLVVPPTEKPEPEAEPGAQVARWSCLDCPPKDKRRVTFSLEVAEVVVLPSPFPVEIANDSGRVVYAPRRESAAKVTLRPGESRNFVYDLLDHGGQPLPHGSYTVRITFLINNVTKTLSLPLWIGK